jgi:hypothetical protein
MDFMWHSKAKATEAAAYEEEDDRGEEILSSCNTSVVNVSADDVVDNSRCMAAAAGGVQHIGDVDEAGAAIARATAAVCKSNDYLSRVTADTLFPLPTIDASYSSLPGDAHQSPPSPMSSSVASMKQEEEEEVAPPSPGLSASSKLSIKPEGLSDSLLQEVLLVETVGRYNTDKKEDDDEDDELVPSRPGVLFEPCDDSVAVPTSHVVNSQFMANSRAANVNAKHQPPEQQSSPPPPPPTIVEPPTTKPQVDDEAVTNEPSVEDEQQVPPPPPPPAIDEQPGILSRLAGKLHWPTKLDRFAAAFVRLPTPTPTTTSSLLAGLVVAFKCMIVAGFFFGLFLCLENFFLITSKMPMMATTDVLPPSPVAVVAVQAGVGSSVLRSVPLNIATPNKPLSSMKEPAFQQHPNNTMVPQPPPPPPPPCNKKAAPVSSTAISAMRDLLTPRVAVRVSKENHEEVIDLDDGQQERWEAPTSGPQRQEQQNRGVPPTNRPWSILLGISLMSATVYASMVASLSVSILLWLMLLGGGGVKEAGSKKVQNAATTDWNFATICTALDEPLSGTGRNSKTIATMSVGWDPTNYEQLTLDEIHRLLHLLHAPSYHRSMNKSALLCFLYEHYGTLLHKCKTQQLKAILQYKGVRYSCGTKKKDLVLLALHAGFTVTH